MVITLPPVKKYTAAQLQDVKLPFATSHQLPLIGLFGFLIFIVVIWFIYPLLSYVFLACIMAGFLLGSYIKKTKKYVAPTNEQVRCNTDGIYWLESNSIRYPVFRFSHIGHRYIGKRPMPQGILTKHGYSATCAVQEQGLRLCDVSMSFLWSNPIIVSYTSIRSIETCFTGFGSQHYINLCLVDGKKYWMQLSSFYPGSLYTFVSILVERNPAIVVSHEIIARMEDSAKRQAKYIAYLTENPKSRLLASGKVRK